MEEREGHQTRDCITVAAIGYLPWKPTHRMTQGAGSQCKTTDPYPGLPYSPFRSAVLEPRRILTADIQQDHAKPMEGIGSDDV
ncbi:Hypothetical predicted protein [Pelobates cultripes]|uniref:Uncharacterized protein n=1 Tax=Pelobates cultripes TaxID=61616 RepID=A0AAD1RA05_PELCU|nr:Hypothetical predicted protein [Pelobates cultripes]